ncbi:hypothetical protein B0H19DRAFT_1074551 [Mycena capillaripes]|nr:hypothetical protein B0H19DRAFT_1074551 [Mycena capillaripes]
MSIPRDCAQHISIAVVFEKMTVQYLVDGPFVEKRGKFQTAIKADASRKRKQPWEDLLGIEMAVTKKRAGNTSASRAVGQSSGRSWHANQLLKVLLRMAPASTIELPLTKAGSHFRLKKKQRKAASQNPPSQLQHMFQYEVYCGFCLKMHPLDHWSKTHHCASQVHRLDSQPVAPLSSPPFHPGSHPTKDQRTTTLVDRYRNGSGSKGMGSQTPPADEDASAIFENVYSLVLKFDRTAEGTDRDKVNSLLASIRKLESIHRSGEEARSELQALESEVALWCDIYSQAFDIASTAVENETYGEEAICLFTRIQILGQRVFHEER